MKKRTIALAVAGMMFGAGSAFAAAPAVSVNGYAAVNWTLTDEFDETNEGQFTIPESEVNFDTENLFIAIGGGAGDSYSIGQAFVKYMITDGWNLKAGKFDSNLTADAGAAPDREFVQHSLIFSTLDEHAGMASATGAAVVGNVGPATVTLGYLNDNSNDATNAPADANENSFMLLVNASPMAGLDLELGILTQDNAMGNITDINATYAINGFTVGLDYAMTSDPVDDGINDFDTGYSIWAGYNFGNGFNLKARYDAVSWEGGGDDWKQTELYGSYALNDNVQVAVSFATLDEGDSVSPGLDSKTDVTTVQLIGTF